MIQITVGNEQRDFRDATSQWLRSSIDQLRHSGAMVCIRVWIKEGELDMILATPGCPPGEPGRSFRGDELKILQTWERHRLNSDEFTPHDLEKFLATLRR